MARVLWACTWTAFTILLPVVLNFNVDDSIEAVEYFQLANSENISDKNNTTGYPFYGIDMRINENATLLVATLTGNEAKNVSVPAMDTKSQEDARTNSEQRAFDIRRIKTVNGRLVRCKQNGTKKCDHWLGNKISITGLALESTHGTLMTCSLPTALDCKYTYIYSGTCWKSNDMGLTWTLLKDIKPKCPTHTPKVDMMFVLDGSGSVPTSNFKTVLDWTKRVAEKFKIEDGTDRIGVVQYSSYDSDYESV